MSDDLPPSTAFLPGGYRGVCPICGGAAWQAARYPRALCADCTTSAVCVSHGLPARLGGVHATMSGGAEPGHVVGDAWAECSDAGLVLVRGHRARLDEARFGGAVIEPV